MHLTGIYAPIVTPFHADETINYPVLADLIEFLIENGISGLVPGGTTGEVYALSEAERLELFQFVKEQVKGRVTLIAGTNSGATRDVIRYSQAAETIGYDALMVAVPPYSRPTQRELLAHYRAVAQSVSIPITLYNFPWRAGTEVGYDVLDGLLDLPNVIGIKEASGEMSRVYEFRLRYGERYQMICGSDDQALDYFLWGTTAWIGGAASCAPRQHAAVLEAARNQANIHRNLGLDVSAAVIWRPLMTQNLVLRLSWATLIPGRGYDDLFPDQGQPHSLLANVILTY